MRSSRKYLLSTKLNLDLDGVLQEILRHLVKQFSLIYQFYNNKNNNVALRCLKVER